MSFIEEGVTNNSTATALVLYRLKEKTALFAKYQDLWWALIILFVMVSGCGGGSSDNDSSSESGFEPDGVGWQEGSLEHNGLMRVFRYFVPENLPENSPTVVLLHGGSQSMNALFGPNAGGTKEWVPLAEEQKFVLIAPNGTDPETGSHTGENQFWNDCRMPGTVKTPQSMSDDVGFLMELDEWAQTRLSVDPDRFYVTGVSNGGMMAYRMAIERPDRVAAIAAFIANLPIENGCAEPSSPVPVFMANGTEDPIIPFNGGEADGRGPFLSAPETRDEWAKLNGADETVRKVTELPDLDPNDESIIVCEKDPAREGGAPVRFCRVEGGGHVMPSIKHQIRPFIENIVGPQNRDVEGARLAWQFLRNHKK